MVRRVRRINILGACCYGKIITPHHDRCHRLVSYSNSVLTFLWLRATSEILFSFNAKVRVSSNQPHSDASLSAFPPPLPPSAPALRSPRDWGLLKKRSGPLAITKFGSIQVGKFFPQKHPASLSHSWSIAYIVRKIIIFPSDSLLPTWSEEKKKRGRILHGRNLRDRIDLLC